MNLKQIITIDFETDPIKPRPEYPPKPVGVAIHWPGRGRGKYYAWGHPTKNNCTRAEGKRAVKEAYASGLPILFHHGKFDVDVGEAHLKLKPPPWQIVHDSLFCLFLLDPHAKNFQLKESAERLFDLPPTEQDSVVAWLIKHQPVEGIKLNDKPKSDGWAGAFLAFAPGDLVGKYAVGDLTRTRKIFLHCYPQLVARKMVGPYDRERELIPIFLSMERQGMRVSVTRLQRDVKRYTSTLKSLEMWLRKKLKAPDINLESGQQVAEALLKAKLTTKAKLGLTPTGKIATNKAALANAIKDKQLLHAFKYRAQLSTALNTFMRPWLATAKRSGGLIFTTWNSTRRDKQGGTAGARTGRLSSNPNFQNIPTEFAALWLHELAGLPKAPIDLPPLPMVRGYIVPYEKGHVLIGRDFASQELRGLAHYECAEMFAAYQENAGLDLHQYATDLIFERTGLQLPRKTVKICAFSILYGAGYGKLASQLGTTVKHARAIKEAYLNTFPGVRDLMRELRACGKFGDSIRTSGGREYFVEPPKFIEGRLRTFEYKLLNYLIQGSSADLTKQTLIDFANKAPKRVKLYLTVHDEIVASVPKVTWRKDMTLLRAAMDAKRWDVPMQSDGERGPNWGAMKAVA